MTIVQCPIFVCRFVQEEVGGHAVFLKNDHQWLSVAFSANGRSWQFDSSYHGYGVHLEAVPSLLRALLETQPTLG